MDLKQIQIRQTNTNDFDNIMNVKKQAFGYDKEAKLVAELLEDRTAEPRVSLLAFYNNKAIGHILFTRAYIEGIEECPMIHILAPLAVIPEFQGKGIGKLLINTGFQLLKEKGTHLIFVLGHKEYYPKCAFSHVMQFGGKMPACYTFNNSQENPSPTILNALYMIWKIL